MIRTWKIWLLEELGGDFRWKIWSAWGDRCDSPRSSKNALYKCLKHLETTSTFLICIMVTNGSCNIVVAIDPIFKILLCFPPFARHKKTLVPLSPSIASKWIQMATHQDQSMESWDKICGCPSLFLLASLLPGRGFVSICFKNEVIWLWPENCGSPKYNLLEY